MSKYVIIIKKLGECMIIKDIDDKKRNFRLLIEELVNSGMSEFTTKALDVLNKIKSYADQKGSGKNAI